MQSSPQPKNKQVTLMVTCLVDTLFPQVGEAVVAVLNKAGYAVQIPSEQTCCGQPAFNAGMRAEARQMAERTIEILEKEPGPVVIPSGSCAAMIRHSYPALFEDDDRKSDWAQRARALAKRTFEFSEFLVDVCDQVDFDAVFPGPVTYHASCHLLRDLEIHRQPLSLLRAVQDERYLDQATPLEFLELPNYDECCGFGGVFSAEHAQVSAAMVKRKLENIYTSQARTVVCCDAGCLANIAGGLVHDQKRKGNAEPIRVVHLAEILASERSQH